MKQSAPRVTNRAPKTARIIPIHRTYVKRQANVGGDSSSREPHDQREQAVAEKSRGKGGRDRATMMRGVLAMGDDVSDDVSINVRGLPGGLAPRMRCLSLHRASHTSDRHLTERIGHERHAPERAYNLAITAEANSEVFTSCAPSIWRAKS